MLYDSTKSLLQSILRSLETVDATGWDDQTESGNACLYEMHQMLGRLYTPFRSDKLNANALAQDSHPEKLTRPRGTPQNRPVERIQDSFSFTSPATVSATVFR